MSYYLLDLSDNTEKENLIFLSAEVKKNCHFMVISSNVHGKCTQFPSQNAVFLNINSLFKYSVVSAIHLILDKELIKKPKQGELFS